MNKASCIVMLLAQLVTAPLYAQTTAPEFAGRVPCEVPGVDLRDGRRGGNIRYPA